MAIKENSADILQRETLEREKELSPKSRICDIFITVIFCVFIFGFAILHILIPDKAKSDSENRVLEQIPEFSSESLFSGEYTASMTKYLSDQFPFRDFFITVKASSENTVLRMENGGIMFGDDTLTARGDNYNKENLEVNLSAVKGFTSALENAGIPTVFAPAGRRVDVCIKDLPPGYGTKTQDALWSEIDAVGNTLDCTYLNLRDPLMKLSNEGKNLYYRTDHHWNTDGAHAAYSEIWNSLPKDVTEIDALGNSYFTKETVTEEFFGTSYSSSGASWITPDSITLMRFDGDDTIPVKIADNGENLTGLYRREFLETRDKYSVFLGENCGRIDIGYGDRKTIVIIKDSFAQSIAPFFAASEFDVVMIDPRFFKGSIYRTITEISPDAVLILMNADTLTTSTVLKPLMRGVK